MCAAPRAALRSVGICVCVLHCCNGCNENYFAGKYVFIIIKPDRIRLFILSELKFVKYSRKVITWLLIVESMTEQYVDN